MRLVLQDDHDQRAEDHERDVLDGPGVDRPADQRTQWRQHLVEHEGQNAPKALTELQLKERSIKRVQTPDDLMGTLVFLASSDSDFMTGQAIVVDGGSVFH